MPIETTKNPDAVIVPAGYLRGELSDKLLGAKAEFGPILGGVGPMEGRACVRNEGTYNFISGHPDDAMNFPASHETRPKQPRYTWKDRGDGVKYGYLVDGAVDHRDSDTKEAVRGDA